MCDASNLRGPFFFFWLLINFVATEKLCHDIVARVVCRDRASLSRYIVPYRVCPHTLGRARSPILHMSCALGFTCPTLSWPTPVATPRSLSRHHAHFSDKRLQFPVLTENSLSQPRLFPPWPNYVVTSNTVATQGQPSIVVIERTLSRPRASGLPASHVVTQALLYRACA